MKTIQFTYNDKTIHFTFDPFDRNVMVNATEMANVFGKLPAGFLRLDSTKTFIKEYLSYANSHNSDIVKEDDLVRVNHRHGTYMHRILALKFAAWLDPAFEIWVFETIDQIVFGHYREHWEAHAQQEQSKMEMEKMKQEMLLKPTTENVHAYFEAERNMKNAKLAKTNAIRRQLNLFKDLDTDNTD